MAAYSYVDFYVIDSSDPKFRVLDIIEDEIIDVIVQKYKNIIFTNKGEVLGDPDFGANLLELLYETRVSAESVKSNIDEQIQIYIPELYQSSYTIDVLFAQDQSSYQDIMFIYLKFGDYDVYAQIGYFT